MPEDGEGAIWNPEWVEYRLDLPEHREGAVGTLEWIVEYRLDLPEDGEDAFWDSRVG